MARWPRGGVPTRRRCASAMRCAVTAATVSHSRRAIAATALRRRCVSPSGAGGAGGGAGAGAAGGAGAPGGAGGGGGGGGGAAAAGGGGGGGRGREPRQWRRRLAPEAVA